MRLPRLTAANAMAATALFLSLAGTSFAAVQLTGAGIKDGTVASADIADGRLGVQSRDVKDASLGVVDLSSAARLALRGATGATGAAGPAGPKGDKGATGDTGLQGAPARNSVSWATNTLPATTAGQALVGASASLTVPVPTTLSITAQASVATVAGATPSARCFASVDGTQVGIDTFFNAPAAGGVAVPVVATTQGAVAAGAHTITVSCAKIGGAGEFSLERSSINVIGIG